MGLEKDWFAIGNRLSELRIGHNYSQEYVHKRTGIGLRTISAHENFCPIVKLEQLEAYAKLYGVSENFILYGK